MVKKDFLFQPFTCWFQYHCWFINGKVSDSNRARRPASFTNNIQCFRV